MDELLIRGLPNGPEILLTLLARGDLSSVHPSGAAPPQPPDHWTARAVYECTFAAAKAALRGAPKAKTYEVPTPSQAPVLISSKSPAEVYATAASLAASLLSEDFLLFEGGRPSLAGFIRLADSVFGSQRQDKTSDWTDSAIQEIALHLQILLQTGWVSEKNRRLHLHEEAVVFYDQNPMSLQRSLFQSYLESQQSWDFFLSIGLGLDGQETVTRCPSSRARSLARRCLSSLLGRLPSDQWIGIEMLLSLLRKGNMTLFGKESVFGLPPLPLSPTPEQEDSHRARLDKIWHQAEGAFARWMLKSGLPFLGILELASDSAHPKDFLVRLTSSALAVLGGDVLEDTRSPHPPFICQPTLEILAMADRCSPLDLFTLASMATKVKAGTASLYRITEDSFHRYLLSGGSAEKALSFLASRSAQTMPQNLRVTLQDWERRFGRVILYSRASLLQFASQEEREAFMAAKPMPHLCKPAGTQYLLVYSASHDENAEMISGSSLIDYDRPLPQIFFLKEERIIEIPFPYADIFAIPEAQLFADRVNATSDTISFEITPDSVKRSPLDARTILERIEKRSGTKVPASLGLLIKAWRGELPPFRVENCILLQVEDEEAMAGLLKLPQVKEVASGILSKSFLLIEPSQLRKLEALLAAHHVIIQKGIRIHRFMKETPLTPRPAPEEKHPPMGTLQLSTQGTRKLLQQAIREGRQVELWVVETEGEQPRRRLVRPLAIRYKGHIPLAACLSVEDNAQKDYRIGAIKGLRMGSRNIPTRKG